MTPEAIDVILEYVRRAESIVSRQLRAHVDVAAR
jgi:hypothetical protein